MASHIRLLGTSHIASQSVAQVTHAIQTIQPDIVALELDRERLYALLHPELKQSVSLKDIRSVGVKGWAFAAFGSFFEKHLGRSVGVDPGADMLAAVNTAKELKCKIALIDQPIKKTLSQLSKQLTWKEKGRFIIDICKGLFKRQPLPFSLSEVPSNATIIKLLQELKPRYPSLYNVLVEERNQYMAKRLAYLARTHDDAIILGVIGAGHVMGVADLLKPSKSI